MLPELVVLLVAAALCVPAEAGAQPYAVQSDVVTSLPVGCDGGDCTATDDGGWAPNPPEHRELLSEHCSIPRVDFSAIDTDLHSEIAQRMAVVERWFSYGIPFIFTAFNDNAQFKEMCTKSALLDEFGDHEIVLSSANTFSYDKRRITLQEYMAEFLEPTQPHVRASERWYHFGDHILEDGWGGYLDEYQRPPFFNCSSDAVGALSFGFGGSGSGVPFHTHGPVFAEVLYGAKEPAGAPPFDPDETSMGWYLRERHGALADAHVQHADGIDRTALMDCTLTPGEVLFVPDQWWHSTLNIGQTVFISTFLDAAQVPQLVRRETTTFPF